MIKSRSVLAACCLASVASLAAGCGLQNGSTATPAKTVTIVATAPSTPAPSSSAPSSSASPSSSPSPTQSVPAGPSRCLTKALKLTVGMANGAAGTIYYALDLTNVSGSTCTLYGYPGVAFVTGPHGSVIGAPADRSGITPLATITLAPGAAAHATLGVSDVLISNNCIGHQEQVHWVQVYPPGTYTALYGPLNMLGCALRSLVTMHVSTVSAGWVA